jgi:hypothetical protein
MIVSIHQPQYLPWLGYFDKIDRADVFVLLDTVQYKKSEWQNRNRIKTARGAQWLTVPVTYRYPQLICEVGVNGSERWQHRQQQALATNYRKAPHWGHLAGFFEEVINRSWKTIAELNIHVVKRLAAILGIATPIHVASGLGSFPVDPDERLIALTKHFGGDTYLAGNGGHEYMDLEKYRRAGVEVIFQDYRHPRYEQLFGEFESNMSVIDLIYNRGDESLSILRGPS